MKNLNKEDTESLDQFSLKHRYQKKPFVGEGGQGPDVSPAPQFQEISRISDF